jgi:hypothetical protein
MLRRQLGSGRMMSQSVPAPSRSKGRYFLAGCALGFAAAMVLGSLFIMPPMDMLRWVRYDEPIPERLARVFNPAQQLVDLRSKLAESRDATTLCRADVEQQRRRGDDLEFRLAATTDPATGSVSAASLDCPKDRSSMRGIHLNKGESVRILGGRVYLGLTSVLYDACQVHANTDKDDDQNRFLRIAEAMKLESSMGVLRIVPTKIATATNNFCEFDIVRE